MPERVIVHMRTFILSLLISLFMPNASEAAGPWKGQVVDQQTKKPIEGAVVLFVWYKVVGIMDASYQYYDSGEVVTDAEGRFQIPSKWTLNIFVHIHRPEIYIFKGGYGKWQIQDYSKYTRDKYGSDTEQNAARLTGEGAVLELPGVKSRDERLRMLSLPHPHIPRDRIRKYLEALDQDAETLGLKSFYLK